MSDEETPWPDDADAPTDDSQATAYEPDYRGWATDWSPPKGGGPATFKIGKLRVQVWPTVFEEDEKVENPVFAECKQACFDAKYVHAWGWEKESEPRRHPQSGKMVTYTNRTITEIADVEAPEDEKEPVPAGKAAKAVTRGKGGGNSNGKYKGLTPEEWDEKDRQKSAQARAPWAVQIAAQLVVNAVVRGEDGKPTPETVPSLDKIERIACQLTNMAKKLETAILASTSGSVEVPPSTTTKPDSPSAPAPKAKAPSKASKKPSDD